MALVISLLILVFSAVSFNGTAQMYYKAPRSHVSVVVENDSYVKIIGKTNVNTFSCDYKKEIPKDTLKVSVRQDDNKLILENASLLVRVDGFDCGHPLMNKDFRQLLNEEVYENVAIRIKSLEPLDILTASSRGGGFSEIGYANVEFEIAGVKNEYRIPLNTFDQVISQYYLGQKTINITDFELNPPKKFMGLVKVDEEISIDFKLNLNFVYE